MVKRTVLGVERDYSSLPTTIEDRHKRCSDAIGGRSYGPSELSGKVLGEDFVGVEFLVLQLRIVVDLEGDGT